jgi:hypothetical protein
MPIPNWYCMDCRVNRSMDQHGRCEVCQSDSVIDLTLSPYNPAQDVEDQDETARQQALSIFEQEIRSLEIEFAGRCMTKSVN